MKIFQIFFLPSGRQRVLWRKSSMREVESTQLHCYTFPCEFDVQFLSKRLTFPSRNTLETAFSFRLLETVHD